jgi:hypothetical protein
MSAGAALTAPAPKATQPISPAVSSPKRQTVEVVTSPKSDVPPHDDAEQAPAAATEIAAAGASLPEEAHMSTGTGLFHSVWTLAFVGVVIAASGAFIFL